MSEVLVRTQPLGGGSLTAAALAGELPAWYAAPPADVEGWCERARAVAAASHPRWLDVLAPAFGDPDGGFRNTPAGERLARAAGGAGVLVTTGQQPGLFGGPVYTWSKALSALALADALEELGGLPVAPVFWAATDDADLAEAASTWVALHDGAVRLRMRGLTDRGLSMSRVPLPDLAAELELLRRASGSVANPVPLELVERAYSGETTVGGAYLELLRGILEPLGVAVLDASHPALRKAADPVLREALRRAAPLDIALRERTAEIERAGFVPQVAMVEGLSPVFLYEEEGRRRIPVADAAAVAGDAEAVLGPNVLLRPVIERSLMPTVAYVAGPGELAYFAQVGAVAEALELPAPLAVPRWSALLVEPDVGDLLARHALTISDLQDGHTPERELATRLLPEDVRAPLEALRRELSAWIGALASASDGNPSALVPPSVLEGAERAMAHRLDRLERRYRAAVKRREEAAFAELSRLRGSLRPGGTSQERALNFLPFLARHGWTVLDDMIAAARAHALRLLGAPASARGDSNGASKADAVPGPRG